jgi:hypothetical protein
MIGLFVLLFLVATASLGLVILKDRRRLERRVLIRPPAHDKPYSDLLNMVLGDKRVAKRLMDYERCKTPMARSDQLAQYAIDRLLQDLRSWR